MFKSLSRRAVVTFCLITIVFFFKSANAQFLQYVNQTSAIAEGFELSEQFLFTADGNFLMSRLERLLSVSKIDATTGKAEIIQTLYLSSFGVTEKQYDMGSIELTKDNKFLYLILNPIFGNDIPFSKLIVLERNELTGRLDLSSEFVLDRNMLGFESMKVSPDGKHLYISSNGIRIYDINPLTGTLSLKDKSIVRTTGNFWISKDGKFITITADGVSVYARNITTGMLTLVEDNASIPQGKMVPSNGESILFIPQTVGIAIVKRDVSSGKLTYLRTHKNPTPFAKNYEYGPVGIRGMEITSNDQYLHVIAAAAGNITSYSIDIPSGTLTLVDSKNNEDYYNDPVRIAQSPGGKFIYITGETNVYRNLRIFTNRVNGSLALSDSLYSGTSLNRGLLPGSFACSPDSKFLYMSSYYDASLVTYDISNVNGIHQMTDRVDNTTSSHDVRGYVTLSPDNKFLYLASWPGDSLLIFKINTASRKLEYSSSAPFKNIYRSLKISSSGKFAYSLGGDDGNHLIMYTRDQITGGLTQTGVIASYNREGFGPIALSYDEKNLYVKVDYHLVTYNIDPTNGSLTDPRESSPINSDNVELSLSPDGLNVYTAGYSGEISTFKRDPESGTLNQTQSQVLRYDVSTTTNIHHVKLTPDGEYFFVGTSSLRVFKRDLTDNGNLIYIGNQRLDSHYFYSPDTYEEYFFSPDSKMATGVRLGIGGLWTYRIESSFPPAIPTKLKLKQQEGKVELNWRHNLENNIIGYEIYIGLNDNPTYGRKIGESSDTVFVYAGEEVFSTMTYWVKAKNAKGEISEPSDAVIGFALDPPPSAPKNVTISIGDKYIEMRWDANTEFDFRNYTIYRSTTNDPNSSSLVGSSTSPVYRDVNIYYNQIYFYWIKAEDKRGQSSGYSALVSGTSVNLPPAIPKNVEIKSGDKFINLSWLPNTETDFKDYLVYRSSVNDPSLAQLIATTTSNFYNDTQVNYKQLYFYWLKAEDNSGQISESINPLTGSPVNLPPSSPDNLDGRIIQDGNSVSLSWNPNTENDFSTYLLFRNDKNDTLSAHQIASLTIASFEDHTVDFGVYYYWVKAIDTNNNESKFSSVIEITIDNITGVVGEFGTVSVYPNPAKRILYIEGLRSDPNSIIQIVNSLGEIVPTVGIIDRGTIDIEHFAPGLYTLIIKENDHNIIFHFVKL